MGWLEGIAVAIATLLLRVVLLVLEPISSAAFAAPPTALALKQRNRQLFLFLPVI